MNSDKNDWLCFTFGRVGSAIDIASMAGSASYCPHLEYLGHSRTARVSARQRIAALASFCVMLVFYRGN